jgi:hypothetical protein
MAPAKIGHARCRSGTRTIAATSSAGAFNTAVARVGGCLLRDSIGDELQARRTLARVGRRPLVAPKARLSLRTISDSNSTPAENAEQGAVPPRGPALLLAIM